MANIYGKKDEELHEFIQKAIALEGASLLIPDLQRPYVWSPLQVTRLMDSLIRGWPFGTLLLWEVNSNEVVSQLARPFWTLVDRTKQNIGEKISRKLPTGKFQMVLDGQQRVQSLLLALAGDSWGFKLPDQTWNEELFEKRIRGRNLERHWSIGNLFLDLDLFLFEYNKSKKVVEIDYTMALKWMIGDSKNGQSSFPKPGGRGPLELAFEGANQGRFIRFSSLWAAAKPNPSLEHAHFKEAVERIFKEYSVQSHNAEQLADPLAGLLANLRSIKMSTITYLEVRQIDRDIWSEDAYNEAVVNIFTRLNAAGRTLSKEEITFAWLKVYWIPEATSNLTAFLCFSNLSAELKEKFKIEIPIEDLVRLVSMIWSITFSKGKILTDKDLLKGIHIKDIATDLSKNWSVICDAIFDATDIVDSRGLEYRSQYTSLNSLAILWAYQFLANRWLTSHALNATQKDGFQKSLKEILDTYCDRWMVCSQWAGKWATGASDNVKNYAKDVSDDGDEISKATVWNDVIQVISRRFDLWVKDLESSAQNYVETLNVSTRERVSDYYTALWLWHRLAPKRWEYSSIQLRNKKRKNMEHDV